ncbi:MAG: prepilin-type N-terminal cleavage/methylation domain-containing protein [Planctomycetes bacterium]|nr:prepilin-type N-terminal cleavage/methylation domain-containing protein [Planctomycetota bacterium]
MKRKGFTLIELLVVIAIIALLLSILIPALSKVKAQAQEILCKMNLHQYQIATEMYGNENSDYMPNPWQSLYKKETFSGEAERYCRWHNPDYNIESHPEYAGPYWPYLAKTKVNICPFFVKVAITYGQSHMDGNGTHTASDCIGGPFEPQSSYSMNGIFLQRDSNENSIPTGSPAPNDFKTHRKSRLKNPSKTFLWAEENMWTLNNYTTHVLNDTALLAGPDGFASFHKISPGQLAQQQSSHKYNGKGAANVLMADGSLDWKTPDDTAEYKGEI